MFAYCNNSPVSFVDSNGKEAVMVTVSIVVSGVVVLVVLTDISVRTFKSFLQWISTQWEHSELKISIDYAKKSKKSDKEKANDIPSYVSRSDIDPEKSSKENAKDILDRMFGPGNWNKGPGSDYNKIKKWIERGLFILIIDALLEAREK